MVLVEVVVVVVVAAVEVEVADDIGGSSGHSMRG